MKRRLALLSLLLAACSSTSVAPEETGTVAVPPAAVPEPAPKTVEAPPRWSHGSALAAAPAAVPMPPAPQPQNAARDTASALSGELARDTFAAGRMPRADLRAVYSFEAEAGEQSLFEIVGYGYSRASDGRVRLAIEDESGATVWEKERDVGATWREFAAFTSRAAGTSTLSLGTLSGGCRFVLVRHSSYPPLSQSAQDLGTLALVHGHLPEALAESRYSIPVRAGEELALKLTGSREEARIEGRQGATDMSAMMARMDVMEGGARMAAGAKALFQSFDLEVLFDGESLGRSVSFLRLTAPRDGNIDVVVRAQRPNLGGGLFDLTVERELKLHRVHGVVVNSEDQPQAGVQIDFLREPDADLVGRVQTDAKGEFDTTVLGGNLAIQMLKGKSPAARSVRVRVEADTPLDLMFQPGGRK